jgi:SCP1.201-like deaminase
MRKFIFVVALAVLVWIFVVPSCSLEFGCAATGLAAHADSSEDCPSSLEEAASDAAWAAARLASIADEPQTAGLFYDKDGTEHEFDSSHDDAEKLATAVLRKLGIVSSNATLTVASHVEVKVAAAMQDQNIDHGVLVINRTTGVCSGEQYGCAQVVPQILPDGAQLIVWSPKEIAAGQPITFTKDR